MKFLGAFVVCAVLALSNASLAPLVYSGLTSSNLIQGPSSRSTIVGPDGSVISSVAPGGSIVTEEGVGAVGHTAPIVAAAPVISAYSTPFVAANLAHTAYSAPLLAHSAGLATGVVARAGVNTILAGPSGTVSTSGNLIAPGVYGSHIVPNAYAYGSPLVW